MINPVEDEGCLDLMNLLRKDPDSTKIIHREEMSTVFQEEVIRPGERTGDMRIRGIGFRRHVTGDTVHEETNSLVGNTNRLKEEIIFIETEVIVVEEKDHGLDHLLRE